MGDHFAVRSRLSPAAQSNVRVTSPSCKERAPNMKKVLVTIGALCFVLTACGSTITGSTTTVPPTTTVPVKTPGVVQCLGGCNGAPVKRPTLYAFAGAGGATPVVSGIHWSYWSAARATGTATFGFGVNCVPNCSAGKHVSYLATITLLDPMSTHVGYVFTQLVMTYVNGICDPLLSSVPQSSCHTSNHQVTLSENMLANLQPISSPPVLTTPTVPTGPTALLTLGNSGSTSTTQSVVLDYSSSNAASCSLSSSPAFWNGEDPAIVACNGSYQGTVPVSSSQQQWTFTFTSVNTDGRSASSSVTLELQAPSPTTVAPATPYSECWASGVWVYNFCQGLPGSP